ncbi:MAG: polysaccharide pyruvyl transferase family protein [Actinomycetota bacterium]|nr:polysaccharide pyruvyl transferase family protein [Actinomycetota bacterium]
MHVTMIGAAFSANKGASSMLHSAIRGIRRRDPDARVTVLTTYPRQDVQVPDLPAEIEVIGLTPLTLAALTGPALVLGALQRWTSHGSGLLRRHRAARALLDSDIVLDLAGISFVDGRGIPLLGYNTLMTGLPLLLGRPVVKGSQAIGPCERWPTRVAARSVLRRVTTICARGDSTLGHLRGLGLDNVVPAADLAFLLDHDSPPAKAATNRRLRIGFVPSEVIRGYVADDGADYVAISATTVSHLRKAGHDVVIVPHAIRPEQPASRMNDAPLAAEIAQAAGGDVEVVQGDPTPDELRRTIASCDVVITSRFHAMISALASATPVLVIGWSHKYREVLDRFGQGDAVLGHTSLSPERIGDLFDVVARSLDTRSQRIATELPSVQLEAERTIDAVLGCS